MRLPQPLLRARFTTMEAAAGLGVVRLWGTALLVPDDAPPAVGRHAAVVYGQGTAAAAGAEASAGLDSAAEVAAALGQGALRDVPLVVIAADGQPDAALQPLRDLSRQSARGCFVLADTSDHYVHYSRPALVVDTVEAARRGDDAGASCDQ